MKKEKIIPLRTPVVVIPYDWVDLIDRRAVFNPIYGIVVDYSQQSITVDGSEQIIYATDVQLKSGKVVSIPNLKHDKTDVFDKDSFIELIKEEIEKIDRKIKGLQFEIADTESFVSRIPEEAEFIREFWGAQLASLKQSEKFFNKKKVKLEDLGKKVSRKLEK